MRITVSAFLRGVVGVMIPVGTLALPASIASASQATSLALSSAPIPSSPPGCSLLGWHFTNARTSTETYIVQCSKIEVGQSTKYNAFRAYYYSAGWHVSSRGWVYTEPNYGYLPLISYITNLYPAHTENMYGGATAWTAY